MKIDYYMVKQSNETDAFYHPTDGTVHTHTFAAGIDYTLTSSDYANRYMKVINNTGALRNVVMEHANFPVQKDNSFLVMYFIVEGTDTVRISEGADTQVFGGQIMLNNQAHAVCFAYSSTATTLLNGYRASS